MDLDELLATYDIDAAQALFADDDGMGVTEGASLQTCGAGASASSAETCELAEAPAPRRNYAAGEDHCRSRGRSHFLLAPAVRHPV